MDRVDGVKERDMEDGCTVHMMKRRCREGAHKHKQPTRAPEAVGQAPKREKAVEG